MKGWENEGGGNHPNPLTSRARSSGLTVSYLDPEEVY